MSFTAPQALMTALEAMPTQSFAVAAGDLDVQGRRWQHVSGELSEQLAARKLDYDALCAEADRRRDAFGPADALKALSSLVENNPGDAVLARDVGFSALQLDLGGQAYHLFRRVMIMRPFEPQNYHAAARCLEDLGNGDLALAYYDIALAGQWTNRAGAFRRIVAMDYLRLLRRIGVGDVACSVSDYAALRRKNLTAEIGATPTDLLVIMAWNTDSTDVDLHVVDPAGEECYYQHKKTKIGGEITDDVTTGFGPEMFTLPTAIPGTYRIKAKLYSENRNRASARTKVYITVARHWCTDQEQVERKVITLKKTGEVLPIATVKW
jgi:tetratricopeptide (TPR) repeat protein